MSSSLVSSGALYYSIEHVIVYTATETPLISKSNGVSGSLRSSASTGPQDKRDLVDNLPDQRRLVTKLADGRRVALCTLRHTIRVGRR
jgi:hypothetical protein